jgi:hypothetical protein
MISRITVREAIMRVCVWAVALVVASAPVAMAQNQGAGFKIGVNFAELNIESDEPDFLDRRTGIVAGVFYVFPVAPHFSFQPEWLYAQKGAKFSENSDFGLDLDYFDVPLLLRWDSTTAGQSTFNVFAGPSLNFRHRARQEDEEGDRDIRSDVERIDVGLIVGAGVEFGRFLIDGRYQHGLKEVNKAADAENFSVKHRAFSIMGGLRF